MVNEKTALSAARLFWGRTVELPLYIRVGGLAFVIAAIVSMSFCQLGFWPLGDINGSLVYLILLLAPVFMGSIAFGPLTGALIGLFGGFVAYFHATALPLDVLESYFFGTPLNTVVLFAIVAFIAGILFDLALKRNPQGGRRIALIIAVSVVISFLASALSLASTVMMIGGFDLYSLAQAYMGVSVFGSAMQALFDSVLIAALCLLTDFLVQRVKERGDNRSLFSVFRNFLVLVSAIVFMVSAAVIFSSTSIQQLDRATENMASELDNLQQQLNMQPDINVQLLLSGYDKQTDGVVFTTNSRGVILASNDGVKFKVGTSLLVDMGQGDYLGDEAAVESVLEYYSSGREPVIAIPDSDDDLTESTNFAFLGIRAYKDGYVALHRTSDMVFANRFGTMVSSTALALLLVAAIAILASALVRRLSS